MKLSDSEMQNRRGTIRLCVLVPYPLDTTPSQRFRLEQWRPQLIEQGIAVDLFPFADAELMRRLHQPGRQVAKVLSGGRSFLRRIGQVITATRYDAIIIHRAICIAGPAILERLLSLFSCPVIYDFDDAIWHLHTTAANRHLGWLKFPGKTATICRMSSHVIVGNDWLADYARQFNNQVTVIPTSIEIERYRAKRRHEGNDHSNADNHRVVVGWTGSSTSQTHLEMFAPVLREFMARREVELRVISNREPDLPGIPYVWRSWKPETEINDIAQFDIGIMPMPDDQWSRGKCALKALQCMATGTPVVCSAVGANREVIEHGVNGMLSLTPDEWLSNLAVLVDDPALRQRLGQAGQLTVETRYSSRHCAALFADVVRKTIEQHSQEKRK